MKNKMKLIIILAVILSAFVFPINLLFPAAKATYVEGEITKDTIWSLVDSPYVLCGNVTLRGGATLTIEPEVEVKFGGKFSLIIEGKLVAVGTSEKMIKFTSNKDKPRAGDWGTIKFNGTGQSTLEYCIIEYGTNGITLENGALNIWKSYLNLNSGNGIYVLNGAVTLMGSIIANNSASGIHIAGGNMITVQNNVVTSNGDGLTLTGNLTSSTIKIEQNQFSSNSRSGIFLGADAYDNALIQGNSLSANQYGFYVSTSPSVLITRNYILNNNVGIFYAEGNQHEAHFNDIYGNTLGVDASSNAVVDATYNYWGSKNGPYHESLNPYGEGNPVGGDGANIKFIFFLTAPIDYNNISPTAVLWTDKTVVAPNQEVAFIGADSVDDGRANWYFFDFGDGENSGWTTLSVFFHKYASTGSYTARLKVRDDFGAESSFAPVSVNVVDLAPLEVTLSLSNSTVEYGKEVSVAVHVSSAGSPLANADVKLFSVKGGSFTSFSGLTDSAGVFASKFETSEVKDATSIRIIAKASKSGFADGSDYKYLRVIPPLTVDVHAEPQTVLSGEKSTIKVHVKGISEKPIANASLTLSTDYGSLSSTMGVTDQNGTATFEFSAPRTSMNITSNVVVKAAKTGYASSTAQAAINVLAEVLVVQVTANNVTLTSEDEVLITVHVEYRGIPIEEANVTLSSHTPPLFMHGLTDADGNVAFTFKAPPVMEKTDIVLTAAASKAGYTTSSSTIVLAVMPGSITMKVEVSPSTVEPGKDANIRVYVKCGSKPLANATVTVTATAGALSTSSSSTDSKGYCVFSIKMPETTTLMDIAIMVNATKYGFTSAMADTVVTVVPVVEGGLPLTTMLLIIVPVLLVVVLLVLVKLNVISVSVGEEESW